MELWNLEIIVPTPHNTPIIMWGTNKIFQVTKPFEHKYGKNKFIKRDFTFASPFKRVLGPNLNRIKSFRHVVQENVLGGSSMIGFPLSIIDLERDMPRI